MKNSIVYLYLNMSCHKLSLMLLKKRNMLMCPIFFLTSLRNNNITDEGIRKLIAKGIQCNSFRKIAYVWSR